MGRRSNCPCIAICALPDQRQCMRGRGTCLVLAAVWLTCATCTAPCVQAGMATPDHTPQGRGYQQALHYFHHDNVRIRSKRSMTSYVCQITEWGSGTSGLLVDGIPATLQWQCRNRPLADTTCQLGTAARTSTRVQQHMCWTSTRRCTAAKLRRWARGRPLVGRLRRLTF